MTKQPDLVQCDLPTCGFKYPHNNREHMDIIAAASFVKLEAEAHALREALEQIAEMPVIYDAVGSVYKMRNIARDALKRDKALPVPK